MSHSSDMMIGKVRGNYTILEHHSVVIDKYNACKAMNNYIVKCNDCGAEMIRSSRQFKLYCECKNGVDVVGKLQKLKFEKEIRDIFICL